MKKFLTLSMALMLAGFYSTAQTRIAGTDVYVNKGTSNWGKGYFVVNGCYEKSYNIGTVYKEKTNDLRWLDIITHIDGVHVYNMSVEELDKLCAGPINTPVEFTILRMGQSKPLQINVIRNNNPPSSGDLGRRYIAELNYNNEWYSTDRYPRTGVYQIRVNGPNSEIQVMNDNEVDFFLYRTFDFEYTNQEDPLTEKEVTSVIQPVLESRGLIRDKDNPDILIFISFYLDKKEQYIPPTQQLTTRYRTDYNFWTKQYETKQYMETHTAGDYTKTEYLTLLKIVFMDAEKAKDGNNKVPPIIWQANYEKVSNAKPSITDAKSAYENMLISYPIISNEITYCYYDWEIDIDRKYIYTIYPKPGGFADKLGLHDGDILDWVEYKSSGKTYKSHNMDVAVHMAKGYYFLEQFKKVGITRNGKKMTFKIKKNPSTSTSMRYTFFH